MNKSKLTKEIDYTGKFKTGDEVIFKGVTGKLFENLIKLIDKIGVVDYVDTDDTNYPYRVVFKETEETGWFKEAELELVNKEQPENKQKVYVICTMQQPHSQGGLIRGIFNNKKLAQEEVKKIGLEHSEVFTALYEFELNKLY